MPSVTSTSRPDFNSDSDEDLLFYMSMQEEDRPSAEEAWAVFYSRHKNYLLAVCRRAFYSSIGDLGVEDLVHDTFVRVFLKAHTYKPIGENANYALANLRAWLGRIAANLHRSYLRSQPNVEYTDDSDSFMDRTTEEATDGPAEESDMLPLVRQALRTLTDREREILTASYLWYEPGAGCKKMPSEELKILMERFQTTAENIRQIRSRAFGKVEQYLQNLRNE
jgi:RNA polymerase sigma factor (sigma-70 family)